MVLLIPKKEQEPSWTLTADARNRVARHYPDRFIAALAQPMLFFHHRLCFLLSENH